MVDGLSLMVWRTFLIFIWIGASSGLLLAEDLSQAKDEAKGQIELAERYFYQGDFDRAQEAYESIQKIYPNSSEIYFKLAEITLEKSEYKKAEGYLKKALEINPDNLKAGYYLASIFSLHGKYKQTIEECLRVLKIEPEFYLARLLLADAYSYEFDTKNVHAELKKLSAITPHLGQIHYRLANLYSLGGDYEKAISEMELVVKVSPDSATIWKQLGDFCLRAHSFPKAIENYSKAILLNPQDVWSHYGLGQAYQGLSQNDEALKHYKIVLDKYPNHLWVLQGVLPLYYQTQDYQSLLEVSKKALEFYPNDPDFNSYLAVAFYFGYAKEGKAEFLEKAIAQFQTVLKINPDNTNAKVWLEQISKLGEQKQSIADKLKNIQTLSHYIIKTDMDVNSRVIQRLVKEERAERIFADVQAFLSELFGKTIEAEPINVSIFTKREDFEVAYESCGCSDPGEVRGFFNFTSNLIAIDSETVEDYFIEAILFHETMHALLKKYLPNPPIWLDEGLAGGALSHLHWQIDSEDLTKILSSPQFASLDIKAIMENKQEDSHIYHLWVYFLLKERPQALKEYLKALQENNKELAAEVFLKEAAGLTNKFKEFLQSLEEKMLIFDDFKSYDFIEVAHQFGHPQIRAEDILLRLMRGSFIDVDKKLSLVFLSENNISFETFRSFIRKERQPFYAGLSEEAERLLGLAAKKSQKKEKPFITTDEFLLAVLEDGHNEVSQLLKDRGVDIKDLYHRFAKAIEDARSEQTRFFLIFPKSVLPGCKIKLFYRLLPEDRIELEKISSEKDKEKLRKAYEAQREEIERKAVKVFLNGLLLQSLHSYNYTKAILLGEEALIIPENQPLGEFKLEIKKEDKTLDAIALTITDKLPPPLINKITASPYLPEEGLMQNLSRLKIETTYWDKGFIPQVTFRQKDKSFLIQGKVEADRWLAGLSEVYVNIPHEILPGEVEVSLQAKLDEKISPASSSVLMKVFKQELPEIVSLNRYTFSSGEKVVIKGKNFALKENVNEVSIGSWQGYGAITIRDEDHFSFDDVALAYNHGLLFDLDSSYNTQTLEIQIPKDINLKGKLPLKIKVFDYISKEVFIELKEE